LRIFRMHRGFIDHALIASGIVLLASCQGVSPGSFNSGSTLAASPSKLSFGSVQKSKSSNLSETLTNAGDSAVTISEVNVTGGSFSVGRLTLPTTLSPQQSVTFTLTFTPSTAGAISGGLVAVSTANNSPLSIPLTGTGTVQGQPSISPASLTFGDLVVGTNASLKGSLAATGSTVTFSTATIDSNEFVISGLSLPATLEAGQTASFAVTFKPSTAGKTSAILSFSSDGASPTVTQVLTGNGVAPPQHSVTLTWNGDGGRGVVGYNIYRGSASGGPYSKLNSSPEPATTYTDNAVAAGQTYFYVTTSINDNNNESDYSNQAVAVIPTP
jgi:Abnormal spindle-like microcephaly-assoc'd, ASPM-SPD-2-Hydin